MNTEIKNQGLLLSTNRDDYRIAWLTALAICIHIVESALPSPLPGVKPGLANVITIVVLLQYGWKTACWVALLRVLVGSILIGTFLSPTFILSLSGALASVAIIGLATLLPGRGFGPIGYSLLAAMAHMSSQFIVAYLLFIPHTAMFGLLPILMTAAVVFGIVTGMIVNIIVKHLGSE